MRSRLGSYDSSLRPARKAYRWTSMWIFVTYLDPSEQMDSSHGLHGVFSICPSQVQEYCVQVTSGKTLFNFYNEVPYLVIYMERFLIGWWGCMGCCEQGLNYTGWELHSITLSLTFSGTICLQYGAGPCHFCKVFTQASCWTCFL